MARDKVNDGAGLRVERRLAMARRSWLSIYAQMQREAARAQAAQVRAQSAARREAEKAEKAHAVYVRAQAAADVRAQAAAEKERKRLYVESRAAHVAAMNADLENTTEALQGFLAASLRAGDLVSFSSLKKPAPSQPWEHAHLEQAEPAPVPEIFMPAPLTGMGKLFGKAKHEQAVAEGLARYKQAVKEHRSREAQEPAPWRRPGLSGRLPQHNSRKRLRSSMSR
jgi:restriction system protein